MMETSRGGFKRKRRANGKGRRFPAKTKIVMVMPTGELKFHDVDVDLNPMTTGEDILIDSVVKIAQGVTESARIGRKCTVKSINWRFEILLATTAVAANTSDIARIIVYLDKQANGATAAVTDILESADYQSFNNLTNKGRFFTLMDRTYALSASAGSGRGTADTLSYGEVQVQDSFFKKLTVPIEFSAGTGAIGEIRSNNIGILAIAKAGVTVFRSKMRIRFTDG